MPSLCSMEAQTRSLRAPRLPSELTRNFGATNSEIPRVPLGRVRQSGEDEMNDVLRDVVLAPGDEYLRSGQAIVVAVRLCPRAHCGEVGACLRLGQVHGSSPLASDHLRQEALLERIRCMIHKCLNGPHAKHLAQREGQIRGFPHLGYRARHHRWHSLAADVGAGWHRVPAAVDKLLISRGEAVRRSYLPIEPAAALAVPG